MKRCTSCQRHLLVHEASCPFCGVAQGSLPRAPGMAWVLVLGLATASCIEPSVPVDDGSGSSDASGSTSAESTSAASITATSTTSPSTTSPSTTAGDDTMDPSGDSMASDTQGNSFLLYGGLDFGSAFECDLYAQDCPVGEKCMPWANDGNQTHNSTRCSPVDRMPDAVGEPCSVEGHAYSGLDSCALGAMCMGVDPGTNEGLCVELCRGNEGAGTCQVPGVVCTEVFELPIPVCPAVCDPMGAACPAGFSCTAVGDAYGCVPQ